MTVADSELQPAPRRKRRKNPILARIEYVLYRMIAWAVVSRSDQSLERWGNRLGGAAAILLRSRHRLALRNLRATFPEKTDSEIRRIAGECWRHFGRSLLEYLRCQRMSASEITQRGKLVNQHLLEEQLSRGKGVILISAHFGSWEFGGLLVMTMVDRVTTVTRPLDNELLERDLIRFRAQTGAKVVDRRRAARHLVRALTDGGVVVLLPDQAVLPREGILSPFLGRPAWTTPVPAKLALKLGAAVVFVFCIPHKAGHSLEFEEPIQIDQLPEEERNPEQLTQRINDVISRRIAARPELWLWMHDRWKATG